MRFSYTGREFDAETGLYYYHARYYDAIVGRFISEDPISFGAGDVNLYRYVENNPVDNSDPSGLEEGVSIPDIIGNLIVGIGSGILWLLTRPKQPEVPQKDSQPDSKPSPTPRPIPIPCDPEKPKKTCKEAFPKYIPCDSLPSRYLPEDRFPAKAALIVARKYFPDGRTGESQSNTKGPCGADLAENPARYIIGYHYNIYSEVTGKYIGSTGQCQCCLENGGEPMLFTAGAVLSPERH